MHKLVVVFLLIWVAAGCLPATTTSTPEVKTSKALPTIIATATPTPITPPGGVMETLTADQVRTAIDIEAAILRVTANGTRKGVVVLDGSRGPFRYVYAEGNDYAINIFTSNLTLHGANGARIEGGDGIYFDAGPYENILIENLEFFCPYDCLAAWGAHRSVTIRNNTFVARNLGLQISQGENWLVSGNLIQAGATAIHLLDTNEVEISDNTISAPTGIQVERSSAGWITGNRIASPQWGIALTGGSSYNRISGNSLFRVEQSALSLEPGTRSNQLSGNQVLCLENTACRRLDASEETISQNELGE